jgi:tRNA (guanine37-N1)-methyltransferase
MHSDVLIGDDKVPGTTSVTSIDIHDISRSSSTYGVRQFFVVTPLEDQQKIVQRFLDFWMHEGVSYNVSRHEAVRQAAVAATLDEAIAAIKQKEGIPPVVIATSARDVAHPQIINFDDQARVWASGRPVLFIFGTGRGLTEERLEKSDFLLKPIKSLTDYNHLSVRSAIAIILDRWLGINEKKCG